MKRNAPVTIETIEIMPDASGAPAVLRCGAYRFAFDTIGFGPQLTASLGKPATGSAGRALVARCLAAYKREVERRTDAAWLKANAACYAEECEDNACAGCAWCDAQPDVPCVTEPPFDRE